MNAGLCPARGHHIPLEPLCGCSRAEERPGRARPGQDRTGQGRPGEKTPSRISPCHTAMQHDRRLLCAIYVEAVIVVLR